jgi:hypothetical protein
MWIAWKSIIHTMLSQVPHCDSHKCNHLWLRTVTVKSGYNAGGLESFKSLVLVLFLLFVTVSFYITKTATLWPVVTNLWLAKCGHNENGYRFQKSFFIWSQWAGLRKLQKTGFSCLFLRLFVTFFLLFVTFWDGFILQNSLHCGGHTFVTC